ncbi:HYR domain-containing protein [Flavobacterium sp. ACAM 123]|uniref:HYR domain-containing protein n=1 Tax=Flavobacterium sp. ACAM 123 TaxID=1189620 RepID=UPI0002E714F0|nr:HYR domain-containing protein [Flavobacterium sp. ACAM 123]
MFFASLVFGQTIATVTTDKLDYYPGEYVIITGAGWQAGETVSFHFDETPKPATCLLSHDIEVVADSQGNIYNNQFLIKENHLGVHFVLTATGLSSGLIALHEFDDSTWSLVPDKTSFCPSSVTNVKFTIKQTNGATSNIYTTVVLPSGYSFSNPGNVTFPVGNSTSINLINSTTVCLTASSGLSNNSIITFTADITAPNSAGVSSLFAGKGNTTGCSTTSGVSITNPPSFALTTGSIVSLGTITRPSNECAGSINNLYSVMDASGATSYTWSVTGSGWAITAGQGTVSAAVTIGTGVGTVSVTANNGCSSSTASSTGNITATIAVGSPSAITSSLNTCRNSSGNTFSISAVSGATFYTWSVSGTGWSVTNGQGTVAASITIGSGDGSVSVTASNACGTSSPSFTGIISPSFANALLTTGNTSICQGDNVNLSITLSGSGNLSGTLSDGTVFSGTAASSPVSVSVSPSLQAIYTIASLSNGTSCAGTFSGSTEISLKGKYTSNAGDNKTICPGTALALSGVATGTSPTYLWSSSGSGSFSSTSALTTVYTPSSADISSGSVILSFKVSGTGACDVTDEMILTIGDSIMPIAKAKNITAQLNAAGTATLTEAQVNNGSSDACGIASLTLDKMTFNCSNVGLNTVTLTVTDINGNASTATAVVTVEDKVAPVAIGQNVTVQLDATGNGSTTPALVNNGSSDACGIASLTLDKRTFNCSNVGPNTVTLTVTDLNGNISTAIQIVTVTDNINPTITAPAATTGTTNVPCTSTNVVLGTPVTADNCSVASVTNNAPSAFPLGTTTVTWTVIDGSGNFATATQSVVVTDNINPTITAPAATTGTTNVACTSTNVVLGTPVTGDNCSVASTTNDAPTTFPLGTTTVTWTVTDGSGNFATATQSVVVTDNINPTITAPAATTGTTNLACTSTNVVFRNTCNGCFSIRNNNGDLDRNRWLRQFCNSNAISSCNRQYQSNDYCTSSYYRHNKPCLYFYQCSFRNTSNG